MTRRLSLPAHGAIELLLGLALLALPFVLGLGSGAIVAAVAGGAVVVGLGVAGADARSPAVHRTLDQTAAAAALGLAVALALAGEPGGAVLLGAAAAAELALLAATRWTRRR